MTPSFLKYTNRHIHTHCWDANPKYWLMLSMSPGTSIDINTDNYLDWFACRLHQYQLETNTGMWRHGWHHHNLLCAACSLYHRLKKSFFFLFSPFWVHFSSADFSAWTFFALIFSSIIKCLARGAVCDLDRSTSLARATYLGRKHNPRLSCLSDNNVHFIGVRGAERELQSCHSNWEHAVQMVDTDRNLSPFSGESCYF